ncbi:MAG TPA: tetratricopeptide repeat protein [Burkholderiaceae bacterium]|nr:tetratricopeptide repeat protein [Burkholderiaceae bacterium]HMX09631.1 tetratricopeptide repeat protein [Burkholderiaceae bacterium]HMY98095.1 tetratricopeptide repeat protein [Burkholderiaceae bacterium]HNB42687.1 tetratricopeptide repeat protein [Burkholderiaceae bacterium]HNG78183.1 tetratricopeptide repeat protein [Burkholderiaceae bacterium]
MKPHAFIAMPFGRKTGPDDKTELDFDRIFEALFRPALEKAGCEVFRADEEQRAGDIRTDMFQELLVADLVLADLTIANPNVWYELGVRHALRARGVVLVYGSLPGGQSVKAFDVYTDRKLRFDLSAQGVPDPATLDASIDALATLARETLASSTRRKVSPVYTLLPNLEEPRWNKLLLEQDNEFSDAYKRWDQRVTVAKKKNLPGDIMTLAGETPTRALALEACRAAGNSLLTLGHPGLALEQFEAALSIHEQDLACQQKKAVCLGRLRRFEEARTWLDALREERPRDAETRALSGRVDKEEWISRWRPEGAGPIEPGSLREVAAQEDAVLAEAIDPYLQAFRLDPSHYYSGINALTLFRLRQHLDGDIDTKTLAELEGGLRWSIDCALAANGKDYWARASLAELTLMTATEATAVSRDWRAAVAVAAADKDWFALDSSRQTLVMLQQLGFQPARTKVALDIVEREITRLTPPILPRQVLLFSGHMMDAPDRPTPRFPPTMETAVAERLAVALADLDAGARDLALCQAAAGGDLLFLEACVQRGVRCQVLLPFPEPEFIQNSMLRSAHGEDWRRRWLLLKGRLGLAPRCMPDELGPLPKGVDPYERCNLWLLNTALAQGPDKLRFTCLWNGAGGDGRGGTQHMMSEAQRRTGQVHWIDTRSL